MIFVFASCLLFILACGSGSSGDKPISDVNFRSGTDALEFGFVDDLPPDIVFEENGIIASLELFNEGASDIKDGRILLTYEKNYIIFDGWARPGLEFIQGSGADGKFSLYGKSVHDVEGESGILSANLRSKKLDTQTETHTTSIAVTTCYPYSTVFSGSVCVDTDVYSTREVEKVCTVSDIGGGTQGAPLAISSVEVMMLPHAAQDMIKPQFVISLRNAGAGAVISPDKIDDVCSQQAIKFEELNKAKISASLSEIPLKCDPAEVSLRDNQARTRCYLEEGISKSKGTYFAPLVVELDYGYTESISKEIEIRKIII